MQERRTLNTSIEEYKKNRKESIRLVNDSYVRVALSEAHPIISQAFGLNEDDFNLKSNVRFISEKDRTSLFISEFERDNIFLGEFRRRRIVPKLEYVPQIPRSLVKNPGSGKKKDIFLTTSLYTNKFPDEIKQGEQLLPSWGAVDMFDSLVGAVLNDIAPVIPIHVDDEEKQKLAKKAVSDIYFKAEDQKNINLSNLISEKNRQIQNGEEISMQIIGSRVELRLGGKILDKYYNDESNMVELMLCEEIEDKFIKRMLNSKVNGKRWFVNPENWPSNLEFGIYKSLPLYKELSDLLSEGGFSGKLLENYLNGNIASYLLNRDGVMHERSLLQEMIIDKESKKVAIIDAPVQNKNFTNRIGPKEIHQKNEILDENESHTEILSVVDEDRELKKLLRKERRKKKKNSRGKPQPIQQRFGRKGKSKNKELGNVVLEKNIKKDAMHIVRPDPLVVQFERFNRILANKKRKKLGIEKREARERAQKETEFKELKRVERAERKRLVDERRAQREVVASHVINTPVRTIETTLEKALREAGAMEVVLEAESKIRLEVQERAQILDSTSTLIQTASEDVVINEDGGLEPYESDIFEDEENYVRFQPITRKKKFRD